MNVRKVINFIGKFVNRWEPHVSYSKSHKHKIGVMQLLASSHGMIGLSPENVVQRNQLDLQIKEKPKKCKVLEVDRNGTILLRDSTGEVKRYSEHHISNDRILLKELLSEEAHDIGYRVGFRDGMELKKQKMRLGNGIKSKILKLIR